MGAALFFAGASELATLTNTFTVTSGGITTPTDPTTVTLAVTDPTGVATTYTYGAAQITRTGTGAYAKDISCTIAGEWSYVWTGTGTVPDTNHGTFTVQEINLGHLYVTPQMLRSRVGIPSTDSSQDYELHGACFAASRSIEKYCSRFFWRTLATEARVFDSSLDLYDLDLGPFNDVVSVASFKTDQDGDGVFETTWATTDYELNPVNSAAGPETRPYTRVRAIGRGYPVVWSQLGRLHRVQITGVYGWAAVPQAVTEGARILAAELFKLKDAPFGVASYGEYGAIRVRENPMVAMLVNPYRHGAVYAV